MESFISELAGTGAGGLVGIAIVGAIACFLLPSFSVVVCALLVGMWTYGVTQGNIIIAIFAFIASGAYFVFFSYLGRRWISTKKFEEAYKQNVLNKYEASFGENIAQGNNSYSPEAASLHISESQQIEDDGNPNVHIEEIIAVNNGYSSSHSYEAIQNENDVRLGNLDPDPDDPNLFVSSECEVYDFSLLNFEAAFTSDPKIKEHTWLGRKVYQITESKITNCLTFAIVSDCTRKVLDKYARMDKQTAQQYLFTLLCDQIQLDSCHVWESGLNEGDKVYYTQSAGALIAYIVFQDAQLLNCVSYGYCLFAIHKGRSYVYGGTRNNLADANKAVWSFDLLS